MSKKIALEIFEEIKRTNGKNNKDAIPHSDDFIHYLNISIGIEPDFAKKLIKALVNSHKVFAIEIAAEDKQANIPRIEGYVECDLKTVTRLKLLYQDELMRQYESEHYRRIPYHQLIKEIMPIINTLNNTPLGQLTNKAIMMGELERMMEKNFEEYTENWKEKYFEIEINKAVSGGTADKVKQEQKINAPRSKSKAGSSDDVKKGGLGTYNDLISKNKNYPLDRVLKIYGMDFFLKAQIRRREFNYLTKMVETGKFLKSPDLLFLKTLIFDVKKNMNTDSTLAEFRDEIYSLERAITHKMYFGHDYGN